MLLPLRPVPLPVFGYPSFSGVPIVPTCVCYCKALRIPEYAASLSLAVAVATAHGAVPMLPKWYRYRTACQVIGRSQMGKTFFALYCRRKHILAYPTGNPIISLEYKSGTFGQDLAFFTKLKRKVQVLNPSQPDYVLPYNPFELPEGRSLGAHVSRLAGVLLKTVSAEAITSFPNYAEVAEAFLAYVAVSKEPVCHAVRLLDFDNRKLWMDYSASMPHEGFKAEMQRLAAVSTIRDWNFEVGTLRRRLRPFTTSEALRRFTSLPNRISIESCFLNRTSLLVNACPSRHLSPEAAGIILGLLLSDVLQVGLENAHNPHPLLVYADEVECYATPDLGLMLDLIAASGIRMTLIHHFSGQMDARSQQSLDVNAGIKVVFGGLSPELRRHYAELAYESQINTTMHKQERVAYVTDYWEEETENYSVTEGEFGSTETTSYSSRLHPEPQRVVTGYDDYSREEKIAMFAARLNLPAQSALAILPDRTEVINIPTLDRYLNDPENSLELRNPHAIPRDDADNLIAAARKEEKSIPRIKKPPR